MGPADPGHLGGGRSVLARLVNQPASPNPRFCRAGAAYACGCQSLPPTGLWMRRMEWWTKLCGRWHWLRPCRIAFYPRLIDQAVSLGLSVYDEQAESVSCPGPGGCSVAGRAGLSMRRLRPRAVGLLDVVGRFRALVLPRLQRHGFACWKRPRHAATWWKRTLCGPPARGPAHSCRLDGRCGQPLCGNGDFPHHASVARSGGQSVHRKRGSSSMGGYAADQCLSAQLFPKNPTSRSYLASGVGDWTFSCLRWAIGS